MTRTIFLVTSALLAILSPLAQAKDKNELRTYAFTSDDCNGPSIGGNMDLKIGECEDIVYGANSIKPFLNKHDGWVAGTHNGQSECSIYTYQHHGCQGSPTAVEELPLSISTCISPDHTEPFLSILFDCVSSPQVISLPEPLVITKTATIYHTELIPEAVTSTSTVTCAGAPVPVQYPAIPTGTVTVYVEDHGLAHMRRSDTQQGSVNKITQDLEPRRKDKWKGPRKGVWMLHPWTGAAICYECYAKSHDNTFKFECRSGPNNPVDCPGEVPDPQDTIIVTHTPVATVTKTIAFGQKEGDLERRSFHRAVRFTHPWYPYTEMCADAEWEKRGKPNSEIRIQKPDTKMKRCDKDPQVQHIDVPRTTRTYELPTSTVIFKTTTVYPAPIRTVDPYPPTYVVTTTIAPPPLLSTVYVTSTIDPYPPTYVVTTTLTPPLELPTVYVTSTIDPAPSWPTTFITVDAEPPCDTVMVGPEIVTTIYQDRRRHHDL